MTQLAIDEALELAGKRKRRFRGEIETEDFDRNESPLGGIVRAKDRAERAGTELVQHTKRTECSGN